MKIIAMDVMSTGVIAYYVLIASRNGLFTPIVSETQKGEYADPVPKAARFMPMTCQGNRFFMVKTLAPNPDNKGKPEIEKLAMTRAIHRESGMG